MWCTTSDADALLAHLLTVLPALPTHTAAPPAVIAAPTLAAPVRTTLTPAVLLTAWWLLLALFHVAPRFTAKPARVPLHLPRQEGT